MLEKHGISADYVRQLFTYKNGILYWNKRPIDHFKDERCWRIWNSKYPNKEAGSIHEETTGGFVCRISINNKSFNRGILVWAIFNGKFPFPEIDHKNRNKSDDRIENLREASRLQQQANRGKHKRNTSGHKGVYKEKNKYRVRICVNKKMIRIGMYKNFEEACEAQEKAAKELCGEFACSD